MLYSLEPDKSVTGGAWYNDQDFESEFVDVLNQQCYRFLRQKKDAVKSCKEGPIAAQNMASASSKDVCTHISELGISKVCGVDYSNMYVLFLSSLSISTLFPPIHRFSCLSKIWRPF